MRSQERKLSIDLEGGRFGWLRAGRSHCQLDYVGEDMGSLKRSNGRMHCETAALAAAARIAATFAVNPACYYSCGRGLSALIDRQNLLLRFQVGTVESRRINL